MAYCTSADIQNAISETTLAQLTDDTAGTTVNATVTSAAIEQADALINSYLRSAYSTIPLTSPPDMIVNMSVRASIWYLYSRRPDIGGVPDSVKANYDEVVSQLKGIRKGDINPDIDEPDDDRFYGTNKTADDRTFDSDTMDMY